MLKGLAGLGMALAIAACGSGSVDFAIGTGGSGQDDAGAAGLPTGEAGAMAEAGSSSGGAGGSGEAGAAGNGEAGQVEDAAGAGPGGSSGSGGEPASGGAGPTGGAPQGGTGGSAGGTGGASGGTAGSSAGAGGGAAGAPACVCATGECCDGCQFRASSFFLGQMVKSSYCSDYEGGTQANPIHFYDLNSDYWNVFCTGKSATERRWAVHIKYVSAPCPNDKPVCFDPMTSPTSAACVPKN